MFLFLSQGPVRFYNNERRANILLKQFQIDRETKIGEFNSIENKLMFETGDPLRWVGRSPPKDQTLRIIERSQVNLTIYAILASCSVLGILMATVFLVFNIKYRNQRYLQRTRHRLFHNIGSIIITIIRLFPSLNRYIKMSSPHLNNLIIVGCMCTYLSVIFLGLDSGLSSIAAFPYGKMKQTRTELNPRIRTNLRISTKYSLHGSSMVTNGWLQSGLWRNVLQDLASAFDIHRCKIEQKSD